MEDIKITYREVAIALIIFNIVMGVLFGSLPMIAALMHKKRKLAWIGFAVTAILGTMLGVIGAYIAAVVFLWLVLRPQTAATEAMETDAENVESPKA
jgi:hypothetical protein